MPFNGSGSYSPPGANYPAVAGTIITSANRNGIDADIATALSSCITKDGQQVVTANIPFAGFKLTGIGAATARTDAASLATIQDGTGVYVGTVGGTVDAITLTPSSAIAAYVAGQRFSFIATGANTGAVTVAVSGLTAKAITKTGAVALTGSEIVSGSLVEIGYDGTQFQIVDLSVGADIQKQLNTAFTTAGTSTAYTLTPVPALASNATNARFRVKFNAASGATPTLAVSGLTAKNLKYYDSSATKQAITAALVPLNWIADVEYDGTDWVVLQVCNSSYDSDFSAGISDGSGAGLAFTTVAAKASRIGSRFFFTGVLTYPPTASGSPSQVNGLPYSVNGEVSLSCTSNRAGGIEALAGAVAAGAISFYAPGTLTRLTNAQMSGVKVYFGGSASV